MAININVGMLGANEAKTVRAMWPLTSKVVLSRTTALPGSPADGDIYIVPDSAGSHANEIAFRSAGAWLYLVPEAGWFAYVADDTMLTYYDGTDWVEFEAGAVGGPTPFEMEIAVSDETTSITTGTAKITFYAAMDATITEVFIGVTGQSSSGAVTADLNKNGITMFSTNPSIDASENTSLTGTAAVLAVTTWTKGDKMTIDIDAAGTSAEGLKMVIRGRPFMSFLLNPFIYGGAVSAPVNSVLPAITGTATEGQTLTASTGTWSGSPTSYAYQWKRAGVAIGGGTAATYLLVTADVGAVITVTVTATNAGGSTDATSAGTSAVAPLVVTDPNFASVVLLVGANGTDGSTTILDESPAARTLSATGNAQIDTAQFKFGVSSLLLDGTASTRLYAADSDAWHFATAPFTVEAWVRPTTTGFGFIVSQWGTSLAWVLYDNSGTLAWNVSTTGSDNLTDLSGGSLTVNTWHHVAVSYDGSKYRMFLNGAMTASSTTARNIFNSTINLSIGSESLGSYPFAGHIDELRITKGVSRYSSDAGFTVPAAAFPRS